MRVVGLLIGFLAVMLFVLPNLPAQEKDKKADKDAKAEAKDPDKKDPDKITWTKLPPHPGKARYGIVAGAREKDRKILFSGGSPTLHSYKGVDADGKPVNFSPVTFAYDVHANKWETLNEEMQDAHSDSHGIVSTPIGPLIVGGLGRDNTVSSRVLIVPKY